MSQTQAGREPAAQHAVFAHAVAPRLAIAAAALCWSLGGFFGKHPVFDSWPDAERGAALALWRAFFSGLCVAPFIRRPRFAWAILPMAACFGLMSASYMAALSHTTAANAIWLQAISPAWVALLTWLLVKEPLIRRDLLLVACAAFGTLLILFYEAQGASLWGCLLALAAGIFYAGVIVCLRFLRENDPFWLVFCNQTGAVMVALFMTRFAITWPSAAQWPYLAAFGAIQLGLPYIAFSWGLRRVRGPEAACIALIEPILLPVWVWLNIGERPAWWTQTGASIILVALAMRYAWPQRPGK